MKIRAFLLALLMSAGCYVMIQSIKEASIQPSDWFQAETDGSSFSTITIRQPGLHEQEPVTWKIDQSHEIDRLLQFLEAYDYQKVDPDSLQLFDDEPLFTIDLQDDSGNRMVILIEEGILIHNDRLYYKVVNGPLQVDWLMEFILSNKP